MGLIDCTSCNKYKSFREDFKDRKEPFWLGFCPIVDNKVVGVGLICEFYKKKEC